MLNRSFMAHGRRAKTKDLLFSQKQRLASSAHWHLALARPTAATVLGCLIARFGFGGNGQACCATVQSANKLIEHPDAVLSSLDNHLLEPYQKKTIFWSLTDYYSVCLQIHVSSVSMKNFKNILYYISKKF